MNRKEIFDKLELLADKVCKELGIIVKPVKTKEDIINAKNFSAILWTKKDNDI